MQRGEIRVMTLEEFGAEEEGSALGCQKASSLVLLTPTDWRVSRAQATGLLQPQWELGSPHPS